MDATDWASFFLFGWGASFSGYVVLQALTLVAVKRPYWYAVVLPFPIMLWVTYATAQAYWQQSNIWPLLMVFASPVAALYLLVLGAIGLKHQAHPQSRSLILLMLGVVIAASLPYVYMVTLYG